MSAHEKHGRGEAIWLTPPELVRALGPFDLDPCFSSPRPWDTAAEHYGPDAADGRGGLFAKWRGMVWCNPPYDNKVGEWLARCADHGKSIVLMFAMTETADFHREVFEKADALLFLKGRLTFYRPSGQRASANAGAPSVLIAYGNVAVDRIRNSVLNGAFVDLRHAG